jgi:hypothetical protein
MQEGCRAGWPRARRAKPPYRYVRRSERRSACRRRPRCDAPRADVELSLCGGLGEGEGE